MRGIARTVLIQTLLVGLFLMMHTQPANHSSRRSFLKAVGGLGSLALAPWSRSLAAESRLTDLLILLPGITGSVLQKNNKDVWAVTTESVGSALTTLGRNLQGLEPRTTRRRGELGTGGGHRSVPDVHLIPGSEDRWLQRRTGCAQPKTEA